MECERERMKSKQNRKQGQRQRQISVSVTTCAQTLWFPKGNLAEQDLREHSLLVCFVWQEPNGAGSHTCVDSFSICWVPERAPPFLGRFISPFLKGASPPHLPQLLCPLLSSPLAVPTGGARPGHSLSQPHEALLAVPQEADAGDRAGPPAGKCLRVSF